MISIWPFTLDRLTGRVNRPCVTDAIEIEAGLTGLTVTPIVATEVWPPDVAVAVMTVEPGFGGQKFLDVVVPKIRRARQLIGDGDVWLQVDGGVDLETIEICADAGADVFVAGHQRHGGRSHRERRDVRHSRRRRRLRDGHVIAAGREADGKDGSRQTVAHKLVHYSP